MFSFQNFNFIAEVTSFQPAKQKAFQVVINRPEWCMEIVLS